MDTSLKGYIELIKATDQILPKLLPARFQAENDFLFLHSWYSIFDIEGRYLYVSPTAAQLLGSPPEQVIGKHWSEMGFTEPVMNRLEEAIRAVVETKERIEASSEDTVMSPGQYFRHIFFPLCESGEVVAVGNLMVDMTNLRTTEEYLRSSMEEQRQAEESLRRSEAKFDKAFYANPNPMTIMASSNGQYIDVNAAFSDLVGYSREELLDGVVKPEVWQDSEQQHKAVEGMKNTGGVKNLGMTATTKSGKTKDVMASSQFIGSGEARAIMTSMTDVTEKKALQADVARLDRLNLIGEMAASLSHEIRNPLTTVRGYLQMIGQKDAKYAKQFQMMIDELDRANGIITEFLSLAKNRLVERSKQDLNYIIHSIRPLIEADAMLQGKSIVLELAEGLPFCLLDAKEVRQLVLNLVRNGFEAIQPGKAVYIRTYTADNKVILSVRDEGPGIPEHIFANLGMPFNTSKENGTGLGLPVCYRIVERHEASMDVHTGQEGTEFSVRFDPAFEPPGHYF